MDWGGELRAGELPLPAPSVRAIRWVVSSAYIVHVFEYNI